MNDNSSASFQAVQQSVVTMLELVSESARRFGEEEVQSLSNELQKTVLMLIAAIVLADEKYEAGEEAFINLLVDWGQKPGGSARYVKEYAESWRAGSLTIPRFFQTAVVHDTQFSTDLAKAMIRELKLIGNSTCIVDGTFDPRENEVLTNYILFLEEYLKAWESRNAKGTVRSNIGWSNV